MRLFSMPWLSLFFELDGSIVGTKLWLPAILEAVWGCIFDTTSLRSEILNFALRARSHANI